MSYTENPSTGRSIKVGGRVHRVLVKNALIDDECTSDHVESTHDNNKRRRVESTSSPVESTTDWDENTSPTDGPFSAAARLEFDKIQKCFDEFNNSDTMDLTDDVEYY